METLTPVPGAARRPGSARAERFGARAFGVGVDAGFPVTGLGAAAPGGDPTRVDRVDRDTAEREVGAGSRLGEARDRDGTLLLAVDRSAGGALRIEEPATGLLCVSPDGRQVLCAPHDDVADADWHGLLIAQALPVAASLRGVETFHASAVSIGDHAVAFTGPSRSGKSTLAAALVAAGARLFTDDVLGVTSGASLLAHPGAGVASVREDMATLVGAEQLGQALGPRAGAVRIAVEAETRDLPLAAIYVLERSAAVDELQVAVHADPRLLLASTFDFVTTAAERIVRQLDVCARISRERRVLRALVPAGLAPADAAAAVQRHMRDELGIA
jgi:hypothetical protein